VKVSGGSGGIRQGESHPMVGMIEKEAGELGEVHS
jgi:hypothetical protein